ncbi:helix-turn-helix domain-containing protein [Brevibacillus laterosporus]|uniref:helix-turn-helix domain-containing protein n=1 Tax=Brevibacillus laterosporus TaxID=1465 RepID=UPI00264C4E79|nr:helix-turn-helix domain-containing protein [Brevibacillus laterosporus]MDN9012443.1 helix-turn-helix domain-containing protein [Brevibacillus laterosporus]MDO0943494.1 helix-turn-helix domain-containing protein [Brevibacillus laterosporus]
MQKEISRSITTEKKQFHVILEKAKQGDEIALQQVLELLEPYMKYLANYINMPREDSIQEMKAKFIEILKNGTQI